MYIDELHTPATFTSEKLNCVVLSCATNPFLHIQSQIWMKSIILKNYAMKG